MSRATERRLVVGASLTALAVYCYACAWVDIYAACCM